MNRFRESGPKHCTGAYPPTPNLGHSRMGRNEASSQSMGRGLRQNWALMLPLVLAGDFGQVTSSPRVSDFLTYHGVVLTSQCSFEESLNKKRGCEELPEELPE